MATSALDNRTESEVIDALELVGRCCTTLVVAHRLSTVRRCDRILRIDDGVVKAYGSFEELQPRSPAFRAMVLLEDQEPHLAER